MKWSKHSVKIFVALCLPSLSYAWFAYDKAAYAGQSGQWQQAMQCMKNVINQNPSDPYALYDAGVAAYRNKEFAQALAYFHQASVACIADNPPLQERALFNEGNTLAQLQRYQEAIASYEKALTLNANNQQAQENIALLKKLLEQQQDQQKNKDQKNNSNQHEQKDDQDNQQQKQRDQQEQQDNQQQESQDNAQEAANNQLGDEEDEDHDGDEPSPAEQQQDQQQQREEEKQQQSRKELQGQSSASQRAQQSTEISGNDTQSSKQEHAPREVSAWLDTILSEREKQDEAVNKALIKMQTAGQPQGAHNAAAHNW